VTRMHRRALSIATVVALGGAGLALPSSASAATHPSQIRNVIYLLGDGMGRTHVTAGRERYYGAHGRLTMETLPNVGQVSTYAVEKNSTLPALVPDSAATGTAWATGVKTYNNAVSVDAYEKRVVTLMEQAKSAGLRTGNVSTAEVTDATPAVMYSHALLRGCQGPTYSDAACLPKDPTKPSGFEDKPSDATLITPIAEQIATNNVADVIFGGGLSRFEPADQEAMQAHGYKVLGSFGDPALGTDNGAQTKDSQKVATRDDMNGVTGVGTKVIGLFNRGNLTVETAKAAATATVGIKQEPSLAEMTQKSIDLLDGGTATGKGFLLQVEGALIDKRSHANDAGQTLGEIKAFDDAVKIAKDFAAKDGHTLVIVTADHECAGFNIIEKDSITNAEASNFPGTGNVDGGNTANNSVPTRSGTQKKDPARSVGLQNDGGAGQAKADNFAPATFRTADDPADVKDGDPKASLWLTYLSGNHTGADVPLFAYGPESANFAGNEDNTELNRKMFNALRALGNRGTDAIAAAAPLIWRQIQKATGHGTVRVSLAELNVAQPGAVVVLYRLVSGRGYVQVFRARLASDGRHLSRDYAGSFPRGSQQTFRFKVLPNDGRSPITLGIPVTTNVV
jgi:alkaline phosphatase